MKNKLLLLSIILLSGFTNLILAKEYHVAKHGNDSNEGSLDLPLLTIQAAANLAQPGDIITVHEGIYRESVQPPRGGTSEEKRIIYQAAPGEKVSIKGSERITTWEPVGNGVWKVQLPNTYFNGYNPYDLRVSDRWMTYGEWHHRGDVFINGRGLYEKQTLHEVEGWKYRWYCDVKTGITSIWANFAKADPNQEMVEINVREHLFMPAVSGLRYITVRGFHFEHAATNWSQPVAALQTGAVGTRMGKHWIIENCIIEHARTVGIILGRAPGVDYSDIDAYGDHIIRNNIIRKCGQGGIAGNNGVTRCVLSGNLIEDINYRREFGGHETAGIKFHNSVDALVSDNLIRRVYNLDDQAAFGMWIDFGNQGTRITRNIVYDTDTEALFFEMNHGPILVDNNILISDGHRGISSNSEALVLANNLFINCKFSYGTEPKERQPAYYRPHSHISVENKFVVHQDDKFYNNIFIGSGLDGIASSSGSVSEYNVFLEGAMKSTFGDTKSSVDPFITNVRLEEEDHSVRITFSVNKAALQSEHPMVNADLVGEFRTSGQTIEDRSGNPITVNEDFNFRSFTRPKAGPLSDLVKGMNEISWSYSRTGE